MKNRKLDIHPYTKQFYKGNIIYFIFALCETLLGAIGALLVSWLIQQLIDLIGGYETGFNLLQLTIITLVLIGGIAVANMISYHSKPKFITRGISQYKEYVFSELTKKNISAFSGENSSTYISALTNDIQTIEQGYLWNTFSMLESLLTFIGAMVLMIWYSPLLTLIAIGLSLLPLIASILTGNKVAVEEKKVSDRNEAYTSTLRDSLGGFSVIKSFKAEAQMIRIFKENVRELAKAQCGKHKMRILVQMFGSVAGITAQLGVFIFGAYLALSGKGVTAGTTMIFVQLMNYVLSPIGTIPTCIAERKAAKALIEKIKSPEAIRKIPEAFRSLDNGFQGLLVVEKHNGLFALFPFRLYLVLQQIYSLKQGVGIAFDFGRFPAQINAQTFHFPAIAAFCHIFHPSVEHLAAFGDSHLFLFGKNGNCRKRLADQIEIVAGLNAPRIMVLRIVGIQVHRTQQMRFRSYRIYCSLADSLDCNIAVRNALGQYTLYCCIGRPKRPCSS